MLRHSVPIAAVAPFLALAIVLTLAACSASSTSINDDAAGPVTAPPTPQDQATVVVVPTPEPAADLPPATTEPAPPVADNFVAAADAGVADVCSLYEPDQLAALLGGFWSLEGGVTAQSRCIWQATSDEASGALISIAVAERAGEFLGSPDSGTYPFESDQGPAVAVAKADNVIIVNVTTNDPDIETAALNEIEAERRIGGDLDRRVAG